VQLAKPVKASQLYNALRAGACRARRRARRSTRPATWAAGDVVAADPAGRGQRREPEGRARLLDKLGYRADVASNGLEALEALERQPYDVVLMDVQMPEMDGLDASRRIRERWPAEARPRIIAMTANAMIEDREACFAAGMDDYLAKPVRPEELAEALESRPDVRAAA
jgi:CheY-like chemotaxis protein